MGRNSTLRNERFDPTKDNSMDQMYYSMPDDLNIDMLSLLKI